jgi:hypothetical protein
MHRRVVALDVHQARISACVIVEHDDGRLEATADGDDRSLEARSLVDIVLPVTIGKRS